MKSIQENMVFCAGFGGLSAASAVSLTVFHSSSTRYLSASCSASRARAKMFSSESPDWNSVSLTICRASVMIRSWPSSPKAISPSSGNSPSTARELCIFFATSLSASVWMVFS